MTWHVTNEKCAQVNAGTHQPFEEAACLFQDTPVLGKSYMDWEFSLQLRAPPLWLIVATIVSSALIQLFGMLVMNYRRKAPFPLRRLVAVWNLCWMSWSFLGFLRMAPMAYHNLTSFSLQDNLCSHGSSLWLSGTTDLWTILWLWGKILEVLVESVLLVLLKQPCNGLLQWFNTYAYILAHGYHLYTAAIPGGSAVIATYFGIVALMNAYCFYLNAKAKPQPAQPTILLDLVHLTQTLSGVVLSVATLHYWKHAALHHDFTCHADEYQIRMFAFGWSGGHVIIGIIYVLRRFVYFYQMEEEQRKRRALLRKQRRAASKQLDKNKNKTCVKAEEQRHQQQLQQMKQNKRQQKNDESSAESSSKTKHVKSKRNPLQSQDRPVKKMDALDELDETSVSSDTPSAEKKSHNHEHNTNDDDDWKVVPKSSGAAAAAAAGGGVGSSDNYDGDTSNEDKNNSNNNNNGAAAKKKKKKKKKKSNINNNNDNDDKAKTD